MLVALQLVAVAATPLKVTVLVPCAAPKFVPLMVTAVPTAPELGVRLVILGGGGRITVKLTPLLARPATVTTTFPVVAPEGTVTPMLVAFQPVTVAAVPLKVTVLLPWVAPKFVPLMVTAVPTPPELGVRLVILGADATTVRVVEPETLPNAALIVVEPDCIVVAMPDVSMVETDVFEEDQEDVLVRSCWLPSEYLPVAVNCWPFPATADGFAGETFSEAIVGGAD
jgi:hypothetical protein